MNKKNKIIEKSRDNSLTQGDVEEIKRLDDVVLENSFEENFQTDLNKDFDRAFEDAVRRASEITPARSTKGGEEGQNFS